MTAGSREGAERIRVGVVDDHAITRRGLCEFLAVQPDIAVVGQAGTGRDAIDLARNVAMDVMLLDIDMPGQSGFDAIRHVIAHAPRMAVLVLSAHPMASYGVTMIRKGASGYVSKQCEPREILDAVRALAKGRKYLNAEMSSLLVDDMTSAETQPHRRLTDRQFQVFLRLARGENTDQIAHGLSLSSKTVATYRVQIIDQLGLQTNSELTYYALKHKLID